MANLWLIFLIAAGSLGVCLTPFLLGACLLKYGKTSSARRAGWYLLYCLDLFGYVGMIGGCDRTRMELDRLFINQYGECP